LRYHRRFERHWGGDGGGAGSGGGGGRGRGPQEDRLNNLVDRIEGDGGRVLPVACDVTDEEQAHALIQRAKTSSEALTSWSTTPG
jgi:NAD(P)-dependent dehydrogenase (short-subunit alcohol dehydrogenase family)